MKYAHLFSLSYPEDSDDQKVFTARARRFFQYSTSNMLGLVFGAFLIALVINSRGGNTAATVKLFIATSAIAMITFFISRHVEHVKPLRKRLVHFLYIRITLGCFIGFFYGIAPLLIPEVSAEAGVYLLAMIYIATISIAIFQYAVMPSYCMLFTASLLTPLFIYLYLNYASYTPILVVLLLSAVFMLFIKGYKISVDSINLIILNLKMKKEITDHLMHNNRLEKIALEDSLTKLANRHQFDKRANSSLLAADKNREQIALMYIDINNFKEINDTYGHATGDKVLIEVANRITGNVRSSDTVFRFGGDEFVVILEHYKTTDSHSSLWNGISTMLNENINIDGQDIELRSSIGVATYPLDGATIEELLNTADRHMYHQKKLWKAV